MEVWEGFRCREEVGDVRAAEGEPRAHEQQSRGPRPLSGGGRDGDRLADTQPAWGVQRLSVIRKQNGLRPGGVQVAGRGAASGGRWLPAPPPWAERDLHSANRRTRRLARTRPRAGRAAGPRDARRRPSRPATEDAEGAQENTRTSPTAVSACHTQSTGLSNEGAGGQGGRPGPAAIEPPRFAAVGAGVCARLTLRRLCSHGLDAIQGQEPTRAHLPPRHRTLPQSTWDAITIGQIVTDRASGSVPR